MRILLTSLSGQLGGLELRLADEARQLRALGHDPIIGINPFPDAKPWLEELRMEGLRVEAFDPPPFFEEWPGRHLNLLKAGLFFLPRLRAMRASLVHVAYAWSETGGSRLWLARRCRLPAVISVHNAFPAWRMTPWHRRLMHTAFRSVRGIYGVSQSALEHFQTIYGDFFPPKLRQEVIHNFVDIARFVPSEVARLKTRQTLGIPPDAPVIGTVGRLDEQKAPLYVVKCFARIRQSLPNAHFIFAGQGHLEPLIRNRVNELGLNPWVHFVGFRKNIELLYPALDLHVLLSLREGFGIATVEAMACGIPVLGSAVPGTRDILKNSQAGMLVPCDDFQAVAQAALTILTSPETRIRMAAAARAEAEAKFSREIWAERIGHFYASAMDSP